MPTISLNTAGAAAQITRDNKYWLLSETDRTITFDFRASPYADPSTGEFFRFTAAQIAASYLSFQAWADVANIDFEEQSPGEYSDLASILLSNFGAGSDAADAAGVAVQPDPNEQSKAFGQVEGDVFINKLDANNEDLSIGSYGSLTLTHEIGHALGLDHPGAYNAGAVDPVYALQAEYIEDTQQYSIMSYFEETFTGAVHSLDVNGDGAFDLKFYATAPLFDDIAAAQKLYGANPEAFLGDTVYGFNSNTDRPWFTALTTTYVPMIFTVYDSGGVDTLDFSAYNVAQRIDLNAGRNNFSNVGGMIKNVSIFDGVVVENAIGGGGADVLLGNAVANVLTGGGGADSLTGGAGADTFRYVAAGDSTAAAFDIIQDFATSSDRIEFAGVAPTAVSLLRSGAATFVFASAPAGSMLIGVTGEVNGRDIAGFGSGVFVVGDGAANTLIGSAAGDTIQGGAGADILIGGAGGDAMFGEAGADTFRYLAASETTAAASDGLFGFVSGEDRIDFGGLNVSQLSIIRASGSSFLFATAGGAAMQLSAVAGQINLSDVIGVTVGGYLVGSAEGETLRGALFSDTLQGNGGNDILIGGGGGDALYGGAGADIFRYVLPSDAGIPDTIFDFQPGVDKIDLSAVWTGTSNRYGYAVSGGSTFLFIDLGGNGTNDMTIYLANTTAFTGADILFG